MHHYFEAITNTAGDSLIGYFARVIDRTTQNTVTLSSDDNGTPIVTVSGVENMAKSDSYGNLSLYVVPGTYHLDIYAPNTTSFLYRVSDVAMNSTKGDPGDKGDAGDVGASDATFSTLATLKAINPATYPSPRLAALAGFDGGVANGLFTYQTGNFTGRTDVVQVDGIPLTTGALVRPSGASVLYDLAQTVQGKLDRLVYVTDARFAGGARANDATDDTAAVQAANDFLAALGGGTMVFPAGEFTLNSVVTLHPRVSIQGTGNHQTVIRCTGNGFISTSAAADKGMTVFQGFRMIGAGRNTGTAMAMAMDTAPSRVQGIRWRDVQIDGFSVGIQMRTAWDTRIEGCRIINVTYGVRYEGQCVSPVITGSQIISEGSNYNDGSIGVYADQYTYSDSQTRRPEALLIDGETRIFGFDTNVWINRSLVASIVNSDIDAGLRIAIRVSTVDYKCVIANNYIATIHDGLGTTMVLVDALAAPNSALVAIRDNSFAAAGVYDVSSTAIQINGANRTGKISVRDNNVGLGAGVGTGLYLNTAAGVEVVGNNIVGQEYSVNKENLGGHLFQRNTLNGPIRRVGAGISVDRFFDNGGSAVTGYSGPVLIPASQTTVTISLSSLGLPANPVIGSPANLTMVAKAMQVSGSASRGPVRAYYDGAGNVVVTVTNSFAVDSTDVNLELSAQ